jgi:biopolymer transport protein ExbB/TolQ
VNQNLRLAAIAAASVILIVVLAVAAWSFDPFKRRERAEQKATVATQQTKVETAKTEAVEKVIRSEIVIRQTAQEAQYVVQQAQGADEPLSPSVAASVRAGVDRLRNPSAPSEPDGTGDASEPVR